MTILFIILMIAVFGKLIGFAIKATWGITKIMFTIVVLPIILIAMVFAGLIYFTIPVLIILGIVLLLKSATN